MRPRIFIALGGNLGSVETTFQRALRSLETADVEIVRQSSLYSTPPVGTHAGAAFLNAAAEVATDRGAMQLLQLLHRIELQLGRTREVHWGPRTIDLDLLLYGDTIIDRPELRVPHPACWHRRFVLDPLHEIAADVLHPARQVTIGELRQRLLPRPLKTLVAGGLKVERAEVITTIRKRFSSASVTVSDQAPSEDAAIVAWLGASRQTHGTTLSAALPALPEVSRLDLSNVSDPARALSDVLTSALGDDLLANAQPRL